MIRTRTAAPAYTHWGPLRPVDPAVVRMRAGALADAAVDNAFAIAVLSIYLFLRFSMAHDLIANSFGINVRYHYVCVPILLGAVLLSGRIRDVLGTVAGLCLTAFTAWMGVCVLTSFWRSGSLEVFTNYIENEFMIFVVCGSLVATLTAHRRVGTTMATAMAAFVLIVALASTTTKYGGRVVVESAQYGNSNGIAN